MDNPEEQPKQKSESLRASIKRKLRRSFRMERKSSTTSQKSNNEDDEHKSWYHYDPIEAKDRIEHFEGNDQEVFSDNEDMEMDEEETAKYKLEAEAKEILRESWKHLQSRIESLGVVTFLSLFNASSETLHTYLTPEDIATLKEQDKDKMLIEKLRVHPLRIMSVLEKTVHRLEDHQRCLKMLRQYGRKHQRFGVPPFMFDYMARSFLSVLKPLLEESEQWDEDISQAWQSLFQLITFGIQRGYSQSVSSPMNKDEEEEILASSGADNLIPDSTDNEET